MEEKKSLIKSELKEKYINFFAQIERFLNKYAIIVIALIVLLIAIGSSLITAYFPATYENAIEKTNYKNDNIIINIVFVCIALSIIYFLRKIMDKIKIKYILAIFSVIFLVVSTIFCIDIKIGPIADQGYMISGGEAVLARAMSGFIEPRWIFRYVSISIWLYNIFSYNNFYIKKI